MLLITITYLCVREHLVFFAGVHGLRRQADGVWRKGRQQISRSQQLWRSAQCKLPRRRWQEIAMTQSLMLSSNAMYPS